MPFPTAIDLFAGAGGLSVGLRSTGFNVVAAVEWDPTAAATYRLNHPQTQLIVSDIRCISGRALLRQTGLKRGELDLLTGCPPCQGFSTLRTKRKSLSKRPDERNELIIDVLRLVRSLRPRALVLENVPGLAHDYRFADFRAGLTRAGYRTEFSVVDAADFGVPQRRQRLVLIAFRGKEVPADWARSTTRRTTVRDAIGGLPQAGKSGDPLHDWVENRSPKVLARIRAVPPDGGSRSDIKSRSLVADCHLRSNGYNDVFGRMRWDAVAPTITSGCSNPSKGRFLHPVFDRAITLREAALLQSFPRSYQFAVERGKEHIAMQIGNAFPPRLIRPFAKVVLRELKS